MYMRTIRHPKHYLVQLVGTGFVLVSLFGCLTLPTESVAGFEPTAYQHYQNHRGYQGYQGYHGYQDYRDHRHYRSYRRPWYEQRDRFTIHKGKKCELRCERIWGSRDYQCREYRC
jgi:hypothetical protein